MVSVPLAEGSILDTCFEVWKHPHLYLQGASDYTSSELGPGHLSAPLFTWL